MKSRDDFYSVLQLGWETLRQTWRLLRPEQDTLPGSECIAPIARSMDQLAYDLRRLSFGKPARMAYSVAYVLNSLVNGSIQYDPELAEKASQIVAVLAEMLLELESTSQITTQEPAEIVDQLKSRWGLIIYTEDHGTSELPKPHFQRSPGEYTLSEESRTALASASEDLVTASETLLRRLVHDTEFPYSPALGRIHYLGIAIRDQVLSMTLAHGRHPAPTKGAMLLENPEPAAGHSEESRFTNDADSLEVAEVESAAIPTDPIAPTESSCAPLLDCPHVTIIEESAFVRAVISTAIKAAGHAVRGFASIPEARSLEDGSWSLLICGHTSEPKPGAAATVL